MGVCQTENDNICFKTSVGVKCSGIYYFVNITINILTFKLIFILELVKVCVGGQWWVDGWWVGGRGVLMQI